MSGYYEIFKSIHVISVICWIASILYLLRVFVYHSRTSVGSESDSIFRTMESKIVKIIMNPSMILTYLTGVINAYIYGFLALGWWFAIKISAVFVITIFHFLSIVWKNDFSSGKSSKSSKFFRLVNEIPTVMMVIAVFMVILKPLE
ncbi:MAG: protoporphyrinogen oxidase HemJ [Rickettsia sp.]|nr:protoporphyrinogen oxidase HemJ [Rickettsia sp.]